MVAFKASSPDFGPDYLSFDCHMNDSFQLKSELDAWECDLVLLITIDHSMAMLDIENRVGWWLLVLLWIE